MHCLAAMVQPDPLPCHPTTTGIGFNFFGPFFAVIWCRQSRIKCARFLTLTCYWPTISIATTQSRIPLIQTQSNLFVWKIMTHNCTKLQQFESGYCSSQKSTENLPIWTESDRKWLHTGRTSSSPALVLGMLLRYFFIQDHIVKIKVCCQPHSNCQNIHFLPTVSGPTDTGVDLCAIFHHTSPTMHLLCKYLFKFIDGIYNAQLAAYKTAHKVESCCVEDFEKVYLADGNRVIWFVQ